MGSRRGRSALAKAPRRPIERKMNGIAAARPTALIEPMRRRFAEVATQGNAQRARKSGLNRSEQGGPAELGRDRLRRGMALETANARGWVFGGGRLDFKLSRS